MRNSLHSTKGRMTALLGTGALLVGGGVMTALLAAGPASADTCAAGATCTITGSAVFTGGSLSVQGPSEIDWAGTLTGVDTLIASTATDPYTVTDATGDAAGWNVTAAATTFTGTNGETLPDAGALSFDASASDPDDTADVPDDVCATGSTCTDATPEGDIAYPVVINTDSNGDDQQSAIFNAAAGTGMGSILVGSQTPGVFWLNMAGDAEVDTYSSTITLNVFSGPDGTS